jgi:hypothetical protein
MPGWLKGGASKYERNGNRLRLRVVLHTEWTAAGWGILRRGDFGHCRQSPHWQESAFAPRWTRVVLYSNCEGLGL